VIYKIASILHIGEAGLEFLDEFQDQRFVSFETCGRNAVKVLGHTAQPACVGRRWVVVGEHGQIKRRVQFFTPNPTVFEFDSEADFRRLRFRVEQLGWILV
jgi:hypothetical protein